MGYSINQEIIGAEYLNLDETDTVNAAGTKTITITPPPGQIYKILSIYYKASDPIGSGSGTHQVEIRTESGYCTYALVKGNFGTDISIIRGTFYGDSSESPSGTAEQWKVCGEQIFISSEEGLDFIYTNNTDVNQTGTRYLRILVLKLRC